MPKTPPRKRSKKSATPALKTRRSGPRAKALRSPVHSTKQLEKPRSEMEQRIEEAIGARVRPYIQMHGGDLEIIELTPENVLKVRMHGACVGCSASAITLQMGVQQILFDEFPEADIQLLNITD